MTGVGLAAEVAQANGALLWVGWEDDCRARWVGLANLIGAVLLGVTTKSSTVDGGFERMLHGVYPALDIFLVVA